MTGTGPAADFKLMHYDLYGFWDAAPVVAYLRSTEAQEDKDGDR